MPSAMETTTRDTVLKMTRKRINPRTIALSLGISTQAVYEHLKRLRADGLLPPKEAS